METLLLKPAQVAELLGMSKSATYALLAADRLPNVRFGRSVRVPRAALEAWIEANTEMAIDALRGAPSPIGGRR